MNFDNNDNDYFLHDFKGGDTQPGNSSGNSSNSSTGNSASGFTFPETSQDTGGTGYQQSTMTPTPAKRKRHGWRWFFLILLAALCVTIYIRYFVPYATESRTTGFVTRVEKRGIIFKTFEGEMISQSQLTDTTRIYSRDFLFSIPNDSLARELQTHEGSGRPVTITCKRYFGTLPWRGASNTIVTAIDNGK